jgi:serine/threonine protein kinase/tetratricopeptide (TPR) repeat protein
MDPRTPCPHPAHLRLFLRADADTRGANLVRAHLEQCADCRAIAARLEAEAPIQSTLADESMGPARQMGSSLVTCELVRKRTDGAAEPTLSAKAQSLVDAAESDRTVQFLASPPEAIERDSKNTTETCDLQPEADSSQTGVFDPSASFSLRDSKDESVSRPGTLKHVTVPGYDILEELGRGGMGVVYKARHRRLKRLVALKMVLAGAHVGAVGLARFRAEAEAVAKLPHSNIVQVYETGEHEGRPFFSLEYVDGGSLDQRINESPTTPRAAAQLIETLACTMQVAHQAGIVHRDLKPANILLARLGSQSSIVRNRESDSHLLPADHWSRNSVPKIADFGLAKKVDDDSSQTRSGTILGTPSYMAPEQAEGKNREVGPAADIYSLGAILYELLVGRPPFRAGNPLDTIRQVIEQEPIPLRQLEPRVPHDLETICLKCLEKDPARRFSSALALAEDLRRFAEGDPIHARPTPAWERAWKWGKRRPAIVALMGVSTLAVLSMTLFIIWHNVSLQRKLDSALAKERQARSREQDALVERHRALVEQGARRLFDSARVAVAASDWATARVDLEKALTTVGGEARLDALKADAQELLGRVEQELRIEADRRSSQARYREFVKQRDEAQFLGTLYTGMDLAANLAAARTSAQQALGVYAVQADPQGQPRFDSYLDDSQKTEILADSYQLMLILAETEAQSASSQKPAQRDQYLRRALSLLDQAQQLGAPSRAFHLRRARYLNRLGNRVDATRAEQAAQSASLGGVLDHFLLADELYRREQFDQAIQEFDRVLELKPGHFWAQYLDALCLLRQQRPAEARAFLSACLAQRSDFVWLYLLRGFAQEELQAWSAAEADFLKAAQMPLDDNARYVLFVNRGVLRVRTARFEDAVADLNSAIKLKPNAYQAYVNLAQAYRRLGKLDLALDQLNRAVGLEPGLAHLYRLRARLHLERHEPTLALSNFDRAIQNEKADSPYQVDDHIERGRLLLVGGNYAEALASFDAALALHKDHSLGQRLRAETLFRLGRFEEVIKAFDRYLETGKPLESVYRGRGLARAELGQYPGAIEDFTKAIELHPTSAVQAYRGWMYQAVDAPKLALRDFELAIELDSKNSDAYNGRGLVRARLGRYREAIQDADTALRLGPPAPRLVYNAARIYAQSSDAGQKRALGLISQALSLLPDDQRRAFWSTYVRNDAAMAALRRRPSFQQIEVDLTRRK